MNWENLADDDFVCKIDDYTLRAEQMDDDVWWWEVYCQDEPILAGHQYQPETAELAKAFAEMVYLAHKKALWKTKKDAEIS